VSIKIYTQTTIGKKMMDKLKISIFIIGALNKKSSISKFIRTFGVLTISDVSLLKAIKLSKSSANNIYIEEKIQEVVLMIEQGYGIAEAFKQIQIFPDIIIQMITSGEEGGNLGELLIGSADYYDDQIDNELKSIIALINPIITVFMGLFIALLMMAIFMPIFQMGDMY
jgi:type IV pilus assembly protein PilC